MIRRDKSLDLALLKVEGDQKFEALQLGSDKDLSELTELIACGFPFGLALARQGEYPAISINIGRVTSLNRAEDGELQRIQFDAAINPGNSGGPLLDPSGKVVGVVVSSIAGSSRVNMAIPVGELRRFLASPEIALTLPTITNGNRHEAFEFTAKAISLLPSHEVFDLELILSEGPGSERRFPMKLADGVYRAKAVPFPARKGPPVCRIEAKFENGLVSGTTEDRTLRVGGTEIKLSQVRNLRLEPKVEAQLVDGQRLQGYLAELEAIPVKLGTQSLRLYLGDAIEVNVDTLEDVTELTCSVVARQAGQLVGRISAPLILPGSLPGLKRPDPSPQWTMDLKKMIPPDLPVTGKMLGADFKADKVQFQNTGLSLQSGSDSIHIFLTLKPGKDLYEFSALGQQLRWRPAIHVHIQSTKPLGLAAHSMGYAMRLEFGKEKDGKIPGKIYLCLPDDKKSYIAGSFTLIDQ